VEAARSYDRAMNPAIVLVAPEHADFLTDEFGRYVRDYDVLTTTSVEEAEQVARRVLAGGGQVAKVVSDAQLPRDQQPRDTPVIMMRGN